MKKISRKVIISLCVAILVSMFTFIGISADTEDGKLDVVAINVAYGDRIQMIVAVDPAGNANSDIEVTYTFNGKTYTANIHPEMTYGSDSYPVFYTDGISMKDIADSIVFEAHIKDSGVVGDACNMSVANYFYTRLYKDGIINSAENTDDYKRKTLYENCLTYGASAQEVLVNIGNANPETLVTSYVFLWSDDENVKVNGVNSSATLAPETAVTPVYVGEGTITEWTLLDVDGNVIITSNYGEPITVTEHTKLVPGTVVAPPVVEDTVTVMDYESGYPFNDYVSSYDNDKNKITGDYVQSGNLSMGLATDGGNKFLQVRNVQNSNLNGTTKVQISNSNPVGECYTFETKIKINGASKAGNNFARVKLTNENNGDALSLILGTDSSKKVQIAVSGSPTGGVETGKVLFSSENAVIEVGAWFTLRCEFYFKGAGIANKENTYLKLSVNGTVVYDGLASWAVGTNITGAQIDHIYSEKATHNVYYDDIFFTRTDKVYKAEN